MIERAHSPGAGVRLERRTLPAGAAVFAASTNHQLFLHLDRPVGAVCLSSGLRFTRRRGALDVVPAGVASARDSEAPSHSLLVSLHPSIVARAATDLGLPAARSGLDLRHLLDDPQVVHLVSALEAEKRSEFPNGSLYVDSLVFALAIHLIRRYGAQAKRPDAGLSPERLRRVTEYIEAHLDQTLDLFRLADVAGLSASQFKLAFKRSTGAPVHAFVMKRRVLRARTLVHEGKRSLGEIALESGFSHQSHMARWMRRVLGVTPSELARLL